MKNYTTISEIHLPEIFYYVHRKCHTDWVIIDSVIDYYDISYVTAGKGTYLINGEPHEVSAGQLLYIPPGSRRQAWTNQNDLMEVFAMNFRTAEPLPFQLINQPGYDSKLISLFTQLTRIWMEREQLYTIDAGALGLQIFCELYRRLCLNKPVKQIDERIEKVKDYINENFNKQLNLSKLAELVKLNAVYLGTLFAQTEMCSVKEYINKVRVHNAYEIIRAEKLSMSDVAFACGFNDTFYFSRVFKKYVGVSPSKV